MSVDWNSAEVLTLTSFVYAQITMFMMGTYLWYFLLSLPAIELGLLTRRVRFQLVHVPYLIGRYAHLMAMVGIVVATHMQSPGTVIVSCDAVLAFSRFLAVAEQVALAAASSNLALRAMAIWKEKKIVTYTLYAICGGHFIYAFVLGIAGVAKQWDPATQTCTLSSPRRPLAGFFILTLLWDIAIMALTLVKLGVHMRRDDDGEEGVLVLPVTVVLQGVGYATLTVLTCTPMTVVFILQLNDIMDIILIPVGCTFSVIASSAAVTSLRELKTEDEKGSGRAATLNRNHPVVLSTVLDSVVPMKEHNDTNDSTKDKGGLETVHEIV